MRWEICASVCECVRRWTGSWGRSGQVRYGVRQVAVMDAVRSVVLDATASETLAEGIDGKAKASRLGQGIDRPAT